MKAAIHLYPDIGLDDSKFDEGKVYYLFYFNDRNQFL